MNTEPPKRADIDPAYTWNVSTLYPSEAQWQAEFAAVEAALPQLEAYQGLLATSAPQLLAALTMRDQLAARIDRLMLYASLKRDEDTTQAEAQARANQAGLLQAQFGASSAFFRSELLALSEATIGDFLDDAPQLETYRFYLFDLRRQHDHVQSSEVETVLAEAGVLAQMPYTLFGAVKDADFVPPAIEGKDDEVIVLTHGRYWSLLRGTDRRVRCDAYHTYTAQFRARQHTFAATLAGAVQRDVFLAKVRKHPSALHAALHTDAIPVSVYETLVETVSRHVSLLHRYLRLRQRILGVDKLYLYDLWAPLSSINLSMSYDKARDIVLEALAPLGTNYSLMLRHGLYEGRWVDVHETDHKRSGAYSAGAFGVPPFILLNWQGQFNDMNTLVHEAGHAMHTYFATTSQPYVYSDYNIFVAEVASTLNEVLLSNHLLRTAVDPDARLHAIAQQLQRIVELLFWQALFAEFDTAIHAQAESGQPLTAAWFSATLAALERKYYGDTVELDEDASFLWPMFPHFYLNFYAYKFATGMTASLAIAQQIHSEGNIAAERFVTFLRNGGSKHAIDLLREAGVDMTTAEPIEQAMALFAHLLSQFEDLLAAEEGG